MRYLRKTSESRIIREGWHYNTQSQRPGIRSELLLEQQGFCAYTERYVAPIDACEIEHFDDRLKGQEDNYWNWYAVHRWINQHKRRIEQFLPLLLPHDPTVSERIVYLDGQFQACNEDDQEAVNLIRFLRWNDPTLAEFRNKHVRHILYIRTHFFADDEAGFIEFIQRDPANLSFITVLEAELGITIRSREHEELTTDSNK